MKISFKDLLKSGKQIVGTWSDGNSNALIEVAGQVGFDFIILDNEHGCHNAPSFVDMVRTAEAAGIAPFFRVPGPYVEDSIKKVLDMGASGILVPNIADREGAELAVRYSKFAPIGNRGCCPYLRNNLYGYKYGTVDYYAKSNEEVTTLFLIENVSAIKNFDDIIGVNGLDGILFGRVDLSVSMGIPGQIGHPDMVKAIDEMLAKAKAKGIPAGIVGFGIEDTMKWAKSGKLDFVTTGGDLGTLITAYTAELNAIRD